MSKIDLELGTTKEAQRLAMEKLATITEESEFLFAINSMRNGEEGFQLIGATKNRMVAEVLITLFEKLPVKWQSEVLDKIGVSGSSNKPGKEARDQTELFERFINKSNTAGKAAALVSLAMSAGQGEAYETREAIVKAIRAAVFGEHPDNVATLLSEADKTAGRYRR